MATGTLTSKGQVTTEPLGRIPGLLKHLAPERPVSVEEMREAVLRRAKEKHTTGSTT